MRRWLSRYKNMLPEHRYDMLAQVWLVAAVAVGIQWVWGGGTGRFVLYVTFCLVSLINVMFAQDARVTRLTREAEVRNKTLGKRNNHGNDSLRTLHEEIRRKLKPDTGEDPDPKPDGL